MASFESPHFPEDIDKTDEKRYSIEELRTFEKEEEREAAEAIESILSDEDKESLRHIYRLIGREEEEIEKQITPHETNAKAEEAEEAEETPEEGDSMKHTERSRNIKLIAAATTALALFASPAAQKVEAGWGSSGRHDVRESVTYRGGKMPWYGALMRDLVGHVGPALGDTVSKSAGTGQTYRTTPLPGGGVESTRYDYPQQRPPQQPIRHEAPPAPPQFESRPPEPERAPASSERLQEFSRRAIQDYNKGEGMPYDDFRKLNPEERRAYGSSWDRQERALKKHNTFYSREWRKANGW